MSTDSEPPYYVAKSVKYLQNRLPGYEVRLSGCYKSYITGLKYHKHVEVPSKNRIYLCLPEKDNKFDPNAVGVYAAQTRIGFIPKDLATKVFPMLQNSPESTALLCYCFGNTTALSSQCCYNLFVLVPPPGSDQR
jgi:hypothetical protein